MNNTDYYRYLKCHLSQPYGSMVSEMIKVKITPHKNNKSNHAIQITGSDELVRHELFYLLQTMYEESSLTVLETLDKFMTYLRDGGL